jgi:hypothetical protein
LATESSRRPNDFLPRGEGRPWDEEGRELPLVGVEEEGREEEEPASGLRRKLVAYERQQVEWKRDEGM